MKDFFDLLAEFLRSDLAKGYGWFFVVCIIIIIVLSVCVTWLYASRIYFKIQKNDMNDLKKENKVLMSKVQVLEDERKKLLTDNKELKKSIQLSNFGTAVLLSAEDEFKDPAMGKFVRKK